MKATPRPLIKWKSFWLGILVLGFLGWIWWDSTRWGTRVSLFEDALQLVHARGELGIAHLDGFWYTDWAYFHSERAAAVRLDSWLSWDDYGFAGFAIHKLPHWLLTLLFLVPWVSFLAWRVRRQRKLTTNASAFS